MCWQRADHQRSHKMGEEEEGEIGKDAERLPAEGQADLVFRVLLCDRATVLIVFSGVVFGC